MEVAMDIGKAVFWRKSSAYASKYAISYRVKSRYNGVIS
jgi:hypothetical protein